MNLVDILRKLRLAIKKSHFVSSLSCCRVQLILSQSSWAHWAGLLSSATEIHVNAPPVHMLMPQMPQYVYHDEAKQKYFGRYSRHEQNIVYLYHMQSRGKVLNHNRNVSNVTLEWSAMTKQPNCPTSDRPNCWWERLLTLL